MRLASGTLKTTGFELECFAASYDALPRSRVKSRRGVIVVVHRDYDAEKAANLRHVPIVARPVEDTLENWWAVEDLNL